jgi:phosphoribosylamine--glycine ligase
MKVLIVGGGGREHALAWKLAQSPRIKKLWCLPGNPGIAQESLISNGEKIQCHPITAEDLGALRDFACGRGVDLTVVGPDNPLAAGIVDLFQASGLRIWGPNQKAAQFESSKAFAQQFMDRHKIPTARAGIFTDASEASRFIHELNGHCAVKADGLALGKGVVICHGIGEAESAAREMLVAKKFGTAGATIVVQELLEGMEISLHGLCDGKTCKLFPPAQDHKRVFENDRGANTGGMGAYCPAPFLSAEALAQVQRTIVDRWLEGCRQDGIDFRGILYPGIMLTAQGPKVLEFNARFGDPEAQVYLTRFSGDLLDFLEASVEGELSGEMPSRAEHSICVIMASAGYPGAIQKGAKIKGLTEAAALPDVKIFHAGTAGRGEDLVTAGGRVLGVSGWGETLGDARKAAYDAIQLISFEGAHYRRDIGDKALKAAQLTGT